MLPYEIIAKARLDGSVVQEGLPQNPKKRR
jgi:hypothetical protein